MVCSHALTDCRQVKVLGFRASQTNTRSSWHRVNLVNQQTCSGFYSVFQPYWVYLKDKERAPVVAPEHSNL